MPERERVTPAFAAGDREPASLPASATRPDPGRFADLPALSGGTPAGPAERCPICATRAPQFDVVDFLKLVNRTDCYLFGFSGIPVVYFRCEACGFMFTDFCRGWSAEQFARFIYNDDYIKVDPDYAALRPQRIARQLAQHLGRYTALRLLDYGSGNGTFERAMRGHGFTDITSYDPFSRPERPSGTFDIVTAFEVLEHTPDPLAAFGDITSFLRDGGCVIATTELQPDDIETIRANWSYAAPRNGHLSLFSVPAMCRMARAHGFHFADGRDLRVFVPRAPSAIAPMLLLLSGPVVQEARLTAPVAVAADDGWWGVETYARGMFRWTSRERLDWTVTVDAAPCTLYVTIPMLIELRPGFVAESAIEVAGARYPLVRHGGVLRARCRVETAGPVSVALVTPPCASPASLGLARDERALGLAISTGIAVPAGTPAA